MSVALLCVGEKMLRFARQQLMTHDVELRVVKVIVFQEDTLCVNIVNIVLALVI